MACVVFHPCTSSIWKISQEDPEFTITLSYKVSAGPDDSIGDLILRRRSWAIPALWRLLQENQNSRLLLATQQNSDSK